MARILVTGMCSELDRFSPRIEGSKLIISPKLKHVSSKADVLEQFRICKNTGNYLITEGVFAALAEHDIEYQPFWFYAQNDSIEDVAEHIEETYDFCVFATANILSPDFELSAEVNFLKRLTIPVILMSVGVQRISSLRDDHITPSVANFLQCVNRENVFCFTRGRSAYEFLKQHGASNVIEACCPSAFNFSKNILGALKELPNFEPSANMKVALNGYLEDENSSATKDLALFLSFFDDIDFVFQDEPLLFNILDGCPEQEDIYNEASGRFSFAPLCTRQIKKIDRAHFYAHFDPVQWRSRISLSHLSFGHRFHGNLAALQSGVPAVFVCHDDRVAEMLSSMGLPYIESEHWHSSEDRLGLLQNFIKNFNFSATEDKYCQKISSFKSALSKIFNT